MMDKIRLLGLSLVVAMATSGCAQMSHLLAAPDTRPQLEAWGPGTVFPSVEAAAVDALIYTYLQARNGQDTDRMRAGTIERSGAGYTYREIHVANPLAQRRIEYPFAPHDVARFHFYPQHTDRDVNRVSERLSPKDRRSVSVIDPLHRPLYVLHPSLVIREYRGRNYETVEVADLQHRTSETLFAGQSY